MFGIDDAALALLVAGGLSTAGALYTNAKNRKLQGNINDASINLANTAHQREVLDLLQAGINPILTAGGSGAPVPQLNAAQVENPTQGLADSMGQSAKYLSEQYKLQNVLTSADASTALSDAAIRRQDASIAEHNYQDRWDAEQNDAFSNLQRSEAAKMDASMQKVAMEELFQDDEKCSEYIDNLKDALVASAKDAANVNWRNNLGAVAGAVSSASDVAGLIMGGLPDGYVEEVENFDRKGNSVGKSVRTRRGGKK